MPYMDIHYSVDQHAVALPNNVLSQDYAGHIFNVYLSTDTDNGNLVKIGDWKEYDVFNEAAVTEFEGKIVQKMPNGNWLVLVTNPGDAKLVYQKPLNPVESPREFTKESAMYNKAGSIVRAYELHEFDRFELSDLGFDGTPSVGATISGVSNKKLTVG